MTAEKTPPKGDTQGPAPAPDTADAKVDLTRKQVTATLGQIASGGERAHEAPQDMLKELQGSFISACHELAALVRSSSWLNLDKVYDFQNSNAAYRQLLGFKSRIDSTETNVHDKLSLMIKFFDDVLRLQTSAGSDNTFLEQAEQALTRAPNALLQGTYMGSRYVQLYNKEFMRGKDGTGTLRTRLNGCFGESVGQQVERKAGDSTNPWNRNKERSLADKLNSGEPSFTYHWDKGE